MLEQYTAYIDGGDMQRLENDLRSILLFDRSTRKNIIWATDDYESYGEGYHATSEIKPELITGEKAMLIRPRTAKATEDQLNRVRDKAEVFTPSWVCNEQNNLIDEAWFGRKDIFNIVDGTTWKSTNEPIGLPDRGHHSWKKYVDAKRLEISCGEAPYLVSRYDATTGETIPLTERIGLLDRKLRIVNDNTTEKDDWLKWAIRAIQSVYGFEFQGDSLLLARQNVFLTFLEYYYTWFQKIPDKKVLKTVARIISWNLWQMDGLKCVVPYSCKSERIEEFTMFGGQQIREIPCPGCDKNSIHKHNGIYCKVYDWRENASLPYVSMMKGTQS